ncbi:MAG TPA: hypothetical protein ENK84_02215 [Desulfobulbus sp.]|nr:hypothetical protein [Desulfobulbus sp.]
MFLNTLFKRWSYQLFSPDTIHRQTYEAFKDLLRHDARAHDLMAELEVLFHEGKRLDMAGVRALFADFSSAVHSMISSLTILQPGDATTLMQYHRKLDFYVRFLLAPPEQPIADPYVLNFSDITDSGQCGNKAFNLAKLHRELQAPVPGGFVISISSFHRVLEFNNLRPALDAILSQIDLENTTGLEEYSRRLQGLILSATIPPEVVTAVENAYDTMEKQRGAPVLTAVRSSAVSEDSEHSFAGQYHTELGATRETILEAYRKVLASKYSPEALFYRITLGLADEEASMGVLVLSMVDAAVSGIVYTRSGDEGEDAKEMAIHAIYGLGEVLVAGRAVGDRALLSRDDGRIIHQIKGTQAKKLLLTSGKLEEIPLSQAEKEQFCLERSRLHELGRWATRIEKLYGVPQDIEWAYTEEGTLFILQSRPLRQEKKESSTLDDDKRAELEKMEVLLSGGQKSSGGIASGPVVVAGAEAFEDIQPGSVLVTGSTPPSLVRLLGKIVAVVAEKGTIAGHFSTVCREFNIPLLIDMPHALEMLKPGRPVTVDADNVTVYDGFLESAHKVRGEDDDQLPFFLRLKAIMEFITPLHLVDPESKDFLPELCRSLHDIIRYTHERAMQTMFSLGEKGSGRSKKKLVTDIPLAIHLLDVGEGLCRDAREKESVTLEEICCQPFRALWKGLAHPGIDWQSHSHFDWKRSDEIVLSGGFLFGTGSSEFASYAIMSKDYLNFNIRFGYHFTLVDTICGKDARTNFCLIRFAGGGGAWTGRFLRLEFLESVLSRLGFEVTVKADLLDAKMVEVEEKELVAVLDMVGRLLGATKLMDMVLREEEDVQRCVDQFFDGQYTFTKPMVTE